MSNTLSPEVVQFIKENEESEMRTTRFAMGLMGYKYRLPPVGYESYDGHDYFGVAMREFLAIKNAKKRLYFLGTVEALGVAERMFQYDIQRQYGYEKYKPLIEAIAGTDILYPEVYDAYDWAKTMQKQGYRSVVFDTIIVGGDSCCNGEEGGYARDELRKMYGNNVPHREFSQTTEAYIVFILTRLWDEYVKYKKYEKHK
jgi:hypothetical protein